MLQYTEPLMTTFTSPMSETAYEQADWVGDALRMDNLTLIFESLLGQVFPFRGFIVLDENGKLLRSTTKAGEFCMLLQKGFAVQPSASTQDLPEQVQALSQLLIESCVDFPDHTLQLYDTIFLPGGIRLNLNAEWIDLADQPWPCILITIDDLTRIAQHRAACDAYRYDLTNREAQVWELYLQGLSYREVGEALMIALNTVKKHMKNIFSKCHIEYRCRHLV